MLLHTRISMRRAVFFFCQWLWAWPIWRCSILSPPGFLTADPGLGKSLVTLDCARA